jgi:hypothetical protein
MQYLVGLLTILAVACGPSSKEVATAKSTRYQGDKLQLFAETKAVVESKYKLTKSDETTLGMQTEARWFSPEGLGQTPRGDDMRDIQDKSIKIALVVTLLPEGDNWIVKVTPEMARLNRGMPMLEPLKEGDASLPGWVEGKVDQLALEIHKALSKYQVKSLGGPPPPPTPGPAPDEPTAAPPADPAAPPAEGSAAAPATP